MSTVESEKTQRTIIVVIAVIALALMISLTVDQIFNPSRIVIECPNGIKIDAVGGAPFNLPLDQCTKEIIE